MLLSNIRPSFYRDKSDEPTLSYCDDVVKFGNTTMLSKTLSKHFTSSICLPLKVAEMSSTSSTQLGAKEDPVIIRFKGAVGPEAFGSVLHSNRVQHVGKVRDMFEEYSAYSGRMHRMDSHEFHMFMKENAFYSEATPKIVLDLMFSKNNKAKESKSAFSQT